MSFFLRSILCRWSALRLATVILVVVLVVAATLVRLTADRRRVAVPAASRAGTSVPVGNQEGRAQVPPAGGRARPGVAPAGVARRVASTLWSFDWAHPPGVEPSSLRRWVTAGMWAELSASPGAPAARVAAIREHETARVVSVTVTIADRSAAGVGVAVSAVVEVSAEGHPATAGREDAEMFVTPTPSGWRVAAISI